MMNLMPDEIVINLPQIITIKQPFVCMLLWWLGILLLTLLLKYIFKGPNMKEGIIAALSILILYVAYTLIYKYKPLGLEAYLKPLPFLTFQEDNLWLEVYKFHENGKLCFPELCSQIASMLLLAFLVNQIYAFKPGNLKTPGWLVFRFFSTMIAIGVHYAAQKVLEKVLSFVPKESAWEIALRFVPIGILCVVLFLFVLALLKKRMTFFFKVVNPTFEGLAGFFFVNKFGVILTRAIYSTTLLTLFCYTLQKTCAEFNLPAGVELISLSPMGIGALVALFVLWVLVGFQL